MPWGVRDGAGYQPAARAWAARCSPGSPTWAAGSPTSGGPTPPAGGSAPHPAGVCVPAHPCRFAVRAPAVAPPRPPGPGPSIDGVTRPIRTLFDSPSMTDPGAADAAAPVPEIEAVLFDFSNTLFHIIEIEEWLLRVARASGRAGALDEPGAMAAVVARLTEAYASPQVLARQVGRDLDPRAHRAAMSAWFTEVEFLHGHEDIGYQELTAADAWQPYPDTPPVLRALAERGTPVGVVSDIGWDLRIHLAHHGLADLVGAVVLSYQVGCEKPDPLIFRTACQRLGADPRRTLMVGDSAARDGGAVAAGLRAFVLPSEHRTGERGLRQVLRLLPGAAADEVLAGESPGGSGVSRR
jgi:HAD superfamily hydrolase (TIGR01509 family)